jgi:hypothetical protein
MRSGCSTAANVIFHRRIPIRQSPKLNRAALGAALFYHFIAGDHPVNNGPCRIT